MEIRKQILGIAIGVFITMSFITPIYSWTSMDDVCSLNAIDIEEIVQESIDGKCYIHSDGYIYC